ncbi:SCO2525 family SAM-dependent methyltransferase [Micromonospora sp. CPCC 206060]|uniref:SCO2525 family SAM-dependent methyltransferase n=1 Tax=Micromonospora sp. CPCC 206060 TaxID=3122406 RepID=UPI002FF27C45
MDGARSPGIAALRVNDDGSAPLPGSNDQFDWDQFDSEAYLSHNYLDVRDDDRQIMVIVRDFFVSAGIAPGARAVDVGAGANLYPSLAMLPFCAHLDLWEYSAANVAWLRGQVAGFGDNWLRFWEVYRDRPAYAEVADPRAEFTAKTEVHQASVFDLPPEHWDLGTMFFVACSLSADLVEFRRAVHGFVAALRPQAPFATAFMAKSQGYHVGERWFPAVAIDADEVRDTLAPVATDVTVTPIDIGDPLREGYGGMIVATGRSRG